MDDKASDNDLLKMTVAILLVMAGVGGIWKYVTDRQPVGPEQNAAIEEQGEAMALQLQDDLAEQLASRPMGGEEQERIDSPMGQALLRKCTEWTSFHENHPDESTLQNRDAACDEYAEFIATGIVPD